MDTALESEIGENNLPSAVDSQAKGFTAAAGAYPADGRPAWAEIRLSAFAHNLQVLRRATQPQARLMAVIKADGYGHGAVALAWEAVRQGVDCFVVALLDEALKLRDAGITTPILILGYTPPAACYRVVAEDLSQAVYCRTVAEALSAAALRLGRTARIHLKVETGMGRVGFQGDEGVREMLAIARLPGIAVEGVFSHFATADEPDKSFAREQLERFLTITGRLQQAGLDIPMRHMANSAAILDLPESHLEGVRPGIALYGSSPFDGVRWDGAFLVPVMTLKARIIFIKEVAAGTPISYGCTYRCPRRTRIATIPLGYADGIRRTLSGRIGAYKGERYFPQVGRICMDQFMIDIGDAELAEGDEVTLFGRWQEGGTWRTAPVEDWARADGTISYEILSGISPRVPRHYVP
ncbi:alanine racemase, putative [Heliomicrobium modesticaldum Ice1]|uniref:Alanine racemase n=1 Tax=Heliobacterium modesticaldum (strain ATCC 51547 / Ice1) TaxID=498761 RepID=B0TE82_HELMI|nr:alanine racemase [Heliomicrobium modesticaldum]ABZ84277.1 alanine racemase, putative [Heliomicrobium modesticaldum Ice1]